LLFFSTASSEGPRVEAVKCGIIEVVRVFQRDIVRGCVTKEGESMTRFISSAQRRDYFKAGLKL